MILASPFTHELIVTGAILGVLTTGWALVKSFFSVYNAVRDTHQTVVLLAENHLPHIQESLNKQDVTINQIEQYGKDVSANVKTVELRLSDHVMRFEDTKKSVDRINDLFLAQAADSIKQRSNQAMLAASRTERLAQRAEEHDVHDDVKKA